MITNNVFTDYLVVYIVLFIFLRRLFLMIFHVLILLILPPWSANDVMSDIVQVEHAHQVMTKFQRLLVRLKSIQF